MYFGYMLLAVFIGLLSYFTAGGVWDLIKTGSYTQLLVMCGVWFVIGVVRFLIYFGSRRYAKLLDKGKMLLDQVSAEWGRGCFSVKFPELADDSWRIDIKVWTHTLMPGMKTLKSKTLLTPVESDGVSKKYAVIDGAEKYIMSVDIFYEDLRMVGCYRTLRPGRPIATYVPGILER